MLAGTLAAAVVATVVVRANNEPFGGTRNPSPRQRARIVGGVRPVVSTELSRVTGAAGRGHRGGSPTARRHRRLGTVRPGRLRRSYAFNWRSAASPAPPSRPCRAVARSRSSPVADRAIIRPLDYVPGYVVPDGQPARDMSDRLSDGGPVFPGPDLNHIWVESDSNGHTTMVLASLDGRVRQQSVPVPEGVFPVADGAGYLLLVGTHSVDDAAAGRLHRISTGSLVAVGPTGWLVVECDVGHRCATVAIQRADDSRHVIGPAVDVGESPGVISPNGATAAVFSTGPTGTVTLSLITLSSGRQQPIDVNLNPRQLDGTIVWSPDSRWLFAATADGSLAAINADTDGVGDLGTSLPPLSQLAIRGVPPTRR